MSAIEKALIQEYATAAREAVLAQAIDALKKHRDREDTRFPVLVEKSCDWDAYLDAIRRSVRIELEQLPSCDLSALWLQTDEGWRWQYDLENEESQTNKSTNQSRSHTPSIPFARYDIVKDILQRLLSFDDEYDDEYSNKNIYAYLQRPDFDSTVFDIAYHMELRCINESTDAKLFHIYKNAAKSGEREAMLALGHYFEHGIEVQKDKNAAINWYRNAGKEGCPEGYLLAGMLSGNNIDLEKAAEAGFEEAMLLLAENKLIDGLKHAFRDPQENFLTGLNWLRKAAYDYNNLQAYLSLAEIYQYGQYGHFPVNWFDAPWEYGVGNESEILEDVLSFYEQAKKLGWEFADERIAATQAKIDNLDSTE